MGKQTKKEVGKKGEEVAASFLRKKGYHILDKNFRCRLGEIDIIAQKDDQIVFVEVKTRKNLNFGLPQQAVTYFKKKRLTKLAQFYLAVHRLADFSCRFDVIAVMLNQDSVDSVHLVENAFESTF